MLVLNQIDGEKQKKRQAKKRQRDNERKYCCKKRKSQTYNVPRLSLSIQQKESIKNVMDILKKSQN